MAVDSLIYQAPDRWFDIFKYVLQPERCDVQKLENKVDIDIINPDEVIVCGARPRDYKTFFVLNSVEHEIFDAHKYKNIKKFGVCSGQISLKCYFSRS